MSLESTAFAPTLTVLSDADRQRIYRAALQVLAHAGMTVQHDIAVKRLTGAGCRLTDNDSITVPEALVEKSIASAPANIALFNRQGDPVMDVGGRRSYFGTGSDLMAHINGRTWDRAATCLESVGRSARLCDALPNIDFIMSFAIPNDIDPQRANVESFLAMVVNAIKPMVTIADDRGELEVMWEIAKVLRGGEARLRQKPYFVHLSGPISPLRHPFKSIDKLIFCAEKAVPVIYCPAPIAGSTAPMTIAGHVVQGLAECLFGLVVHQLTVPGAPFIMGMGPAVLDMATSQCSYNAPEFLMAYTAVVEMSNALDIPNWGYAGTTDAQVPDGQAFYEAGLLTYLSVVTGSNLNHDVGYFDFARAGSLEMVVIMDEVIDQIRRMHKGIEIDEDQLAVEVIAQGARQGHFLTQPHTLKHLRRTQWRPRLICRRGYDRWTREGRTTIMQRAHDRVAHILATHQPAALPADRLAAISRITDNHARRVDRR